MTIKQKLILGIGSIITAFTISSVVAIKQINNIEEISSLTGNESVPYAILAAETKFQSCQIQQFATDGSLTQDKESLKEAEESYKLFNENLNKFEEMFKKENAKESLDIVNKAREESKLLYEISLKMFESYKISKEDGNQIMEELDSKAVILAQLVDKLKQEQIDEAITNSKLTIQKSEFTLNTTIIMTVIGLLLGLIIGVILTSQIVNSLQDFRNGLLSFFAYLNREKSTAELINVSTKDEFGEMAKVVNQNIEKTKNGIEEDRRLINETIAVLSEFEQGDLCQRLNLEVSNPALMQLKSVLNKMAENLETNIDNVLKILEEYSTYNYLNKVDEKGLKEHLLKLANGVNGLGDAISTMLLENKANGLTLDKSSQLLLSNVDKLNLSTNEAAASLEETAAALEEITSTIRNNTNNILKMSDYSNNVITSATQGESLANQTTVAMEQINEQVNSITDAIMIIDQIAFQTNILSLNAAVEAATAGEAGKGFAVVAQEVRNLASRSAEAAREIKAIVENAKNKADEGKNIATKMILGYKELNENIQQTTNLIHNIEMTSKEQLSGIEQINDAVNQLDRETQENAQIAFQTRDIAGTTDQIAKLVLTNVDEKKFNGKDSVKEKSINFQKQEQFNITSKISSKKIESKESKKVLIEAKKDKSDEWESF